MAEDNVVYMVATLSFVAGMVFHAIIQTLGWL